MSNDKIPLQKLELKKRYASLEKIAGKEFKKIKKFIAQAQNGENNKGVDISEQTERKYIDAFTMMYNNIKKPLSKLNKEDLTELKQNLKKGKIQSKFNRPYSLNTQREMEIILIRFLSFLNPKFALFKKWFVVKVPRKSVEYLKEEEIEKLFKACRTNEQRFLIAVLFDSGMRAGEFINTRFEDWEKPTSDFPYYKVLIKEEYSKTKERNIGLFWKNSTEAIKDYLEELDDSNLKAPVITKNYDAIRIFLTRLGKKILKKNIHFHKFRKSSASFYATKLNRQQLCYRYGWTFASNVPDVYISREIGQEEVKENMINSSVEKLEKENQELKVKISLISEQQTEIQPYINLLKNIISDHKTALKVDKKKEWEIDYKIS